MTVKLLNCGHPATTPKPGYIGTGVAYITVPGTAPDQASYTMCYACADEDMRQYGLTTQDETMLYLGMDGYRVTTWSGGIMGRVTRYTPSRSRVDVQVLDVNGRRWYGTGPRDSGTYLRLHAYKGQ